MQQGAIIGGGGGSESPDSSSRPQMLPQLGPSSSLIAIGGRSATPPVEDCTHKTQRCSHAMYAYTSVPPACYTGVPCAAYSNNNKTCNIDIDYNRDHDDTENYIANISGKLFIILICVSIIFVITTIIVIVF